MAHGSRRMAQGPRDDGRANQLELSKSGSERGRHDWLGCAGVKPRSALDWAVAMLSPLWGQREGQKVNCS